MRFLRPTLVGLAAIVAVVTPANAATSPGYSGSWPVTVTHSQHSDGTYCLTLKDGGSQGFKHSGFATLVIGNTKYTFGTFQVINRTLIATIQAQGYGQNAGLVFVASASHGNVNKGVFEDVYGGEDFDSGALAFGARNGC